MREIISRSHTYLTWLSCKRSNFEGMFGVVQPLRISFPFFNGKSNSDAPQPTDNQATMETVDLFGRIGPEEGKSGSDCQHPLKEKNHQRVNCLTQK